MTEENRELTFGGKAVGLSFNPSANENVNRIKGLCAELIDFMHSFTHGENQEVIRMAKIAITELQTAQMWAVKTVTWNY